jgi:hypothetical protein
VAEGQAMIKRRLFFYVVEVLSNVVCGGALATDTMQQRAAANLGTRHCMIERLVEP